MYEMESGSYALNEGGKRRMVFYILFVLWRGAGGRAGGIMIMLHRQRWVRRCIEIYLFFTIIDCVYM